METQKCMGNNQATNYCKYPKCDIVNPLICNQWQDCTCMVHYHNQTFQLISIKKINQCRQLLQNKILDKLRIEIENFFKKQQTQFQGILQQSKQKVLKALQQYQIQNLKIQKNIFSSVFINKQSYTKLDGSQIDHVVKKTQNLNNINIQQPVRPLFDTFTTDLKTLLTNIMEQYTNTTDSFVKNIQKIEIQQKFEFQQIFARDQIVDQLRNLSKKNNLQLMLKNEKIDKLPKILLSHKFQDLTTLQLDKCIIPNQSFRCFIKYKNPSLKILALLYIPTVTQNLKYIIKANLPNLVQFKGFGSNLSDEDCKVVSQANWPKLGYINFHSNKITNKGAKYLIDKYSDKFWRLDLDGNKLNDELKELILKAKWSNLTQIHLSANQFSQKTIIELTNYFDTLKLKKIYIS